MDKPMRRGFLWGLKEKIKIQVFEETVLGFGSLPCKAPLPCLRLRAAKAARGPPSKGKEKHSQIPPLAVSLLPQDPLGAERCKKSRNCGRGDLEQS